MEVFVTKMTQVRILMQSQTRTLTRTLTLTLTLALTPTVPTGDPNEVDPLWGDSAGVSGDTPGCRLLVPAGHGMSAAAQGVDYMSPNASCLRTFSFCYTHPHKRVSSCGSGAGTTADDVSSTGASLPYCAGPSTLTVRLCFPSLKSGSVSALLSGAVSSSAEPGSDRSDNDDGFGQVLGGGTAEAFGEPEADADTCSWTAHVDMQDVLVPASTTLLPYGIGAFTSLRRWLSSRNEKAGDDLDGAHGTHDDRAVLLPEKVFHGLWVRLVRFRRTASVTATVGGDILDPNPNPNPHSELHDSTSFLKRRTMSSSATSASVSAQAWENVWKNVEQVASMRNTLGVEHGRVAVSTLTSKTTDVGSGGTTRGGTSIGAEVGKVFAWAWHTWWGGEVALRVILEPATHGGGGSHVKYSGSAELRASDTRTCRVLFDELPVLVARLTAGHVQVGSK